MCFYSLPNGLGDCESNTAQMLVVEREIGPEVMPLLSPAAVQLNM